MFLAPQLLGPLGLQPDVIDFHGTWSGSGTINVGSLVQLDIQQTTATTHAVGGSASIFAHTQVPNNSGDYYQLYQYAVYAVYIRTPRGDAEAITQGQQGVFRLCGPVSALLTNDDDDTAADAGAPVWAGSSRQLHTNVEASMTTDLRKCLGWINETSAFGDSSTLRAATFNGLGIGMVYTSAA